MNSSQQQHINAKQLELAKLCEKYAFTNISESDLRLKDLYKSLQIHHNQEVLLQYHLISGFVRNQLYKYENSIEHYSAAVELLDELGNVKDKIDAYVDFSGTYNNLRDKKSAEKWLDKANELLIAFPAPKLLSRIHCRYGYINLHLHDFPEATEAFLEAEKVLTRHVKELTTKDYYFLALVYSGLGKIYEQSNDWEKSTKAFKNAVRICENFNINTRISWHYLHLGNAYMSLGDIKNAEHYFKKAIKDKNDLNFQAKASAFGNLGYLFLNEGKHNKALDLFDQAEKLYRENAEEDHANLASIDLWRGNVFEDLDKDKKALKLYHIAYQHARIARDFKQLCGITKAISLLHAKHESFKAAYETQLLYEEMLEQYHQEVKQKRLVEMEVRYEAEKKKKESEQLQLVATKLQLQALRAQMNPHFMNNALNSILDYMEAGDSAKASGFLSQFAKLMRTNLKYSSVELISLEDEIEFLEDYLHLNAKLRFEGKMDYKISVDDEIEEDIFGVPTMLAQPFIENAIEHGIRSINNGFISVEFISIDDNTIKCIIEDNGIGRKAASKSNNSKKHNDKSRGIEITKQRLQILHNSEKKSGLIQIIDLVDKKTANALGTRVELIIPIKILQHTSGFE